MSQPTLMSPFPVSYRAGAVALIGAAAVLGTAVTAVARFTPEQTCQQGRYAAAAKYDACEKKVRGQLLGGVAFAGNDETKIQAAFSKCRVKYAATWAKLREKANGSGSSCDNARFQDHGDGTVIDRLTGLQWEQKTNNGNLHDKDNVFAWSDPANGDVTDADGTVYTSFLAVLNGGTCFAGQCDWRLPTVGELETILLDAYPCGPLPCVDQTIFGPTDYGHVYWSASTTATSPAGAWVVSMIEGTVYYSVGGKNLDISVRAVRGAL